MTDIVKELRKGVQYDGLNLITEAEATMAEAADEIERLRKVVIEVAKQGRIEETRPVRTRTAFERDYDNLVRLAREALT